MDTQKYPRRSGDILKNPRGVLSRVYRQSQDLLKLQSIVRQFAPNHIHVASLRDETLHLITDSSAIATQLRYRQRNIISALSRADNNLVIKNVKVSVRPDDPKDPRPPREPIPLSGENARQMADTAKYIEDDALRKALLKLSTRVR